MKSFRFISLLFAASLSLLAATTTETIPLWPHGAPGAKGDKPEDTPRVEVYPATDHPCGGGMVVCPGGGYGGLAADHEGRQVAQFYNSLGVTAFVLYYRLGSKGYHHPIEVNDAKRALRWVRSHAEEYALDPQRIGITGFSAGGHLASSAATLFDDGDASADDLIDRVSSRPNVCVLGYPVITMMNDFTHKGSRANLLGPDKDNDELAAKLSSQNNVTARTPTTFIFQTDEDTTVPAENAVGFYLALRKNKVPAEMHIYQRGPHGVGLMHGDPVLGSWRFHLADWLRGNGFLGATKRGSVEGTVTINGKPVSWGSVTFLPEDSRAPAMTARVRNGKFELPSADGPPLGIHRLKVMYSSADVPSISSTEAPEGVVIASKASPDAPHELTARIEPGSNHLALELKHP
ncbi:MAG TPA: alpha/beta hydrolase [Verrucomicrobiaceae bacterium]|jgi:acetyl esterase/lipase